MNNLSKKVKTVIVYGNVDSVYPHPDGLGITEAVAVPNTKDGKKLFQPYKEKYSWRGIKITKEIMSINEFNKLNKTQDNAINLLEIRNK